MMQTLTEDDIDEICELFEEVWCVDHSGPKGIAAFLTQEVVEQPTDPTLLCSLAEMDMERSWMAWGKRIDAFDPSDNIQSVPSSASAPSPSHGILASLKSMVTFKDYESLFSDPQTFLAAQTDLARCESRCREQWGDAVGPIHYRHHFDIEVGLNTDFHTLEVKIEMDEQRGSSVAMIPLRGCNHFGRRRSFDTTDHGFEETPDGHRIIVGGFREATISRKYFSVQLLNSSRCLVRNECPINQLRVMGEKDLGYQDEWLVAHPFSIRLPGRTLRFLKPRC